MSKHSSLPGDQIRILLAEDDSISLKVLRKTLEGWGHQILAAKDGQEAWEIFTERKPKFVIADWLMPKMDGLTLCRKIRSSEASGYVYIILLTGKDAKEDIVEGLNAGADDYVTKPFERDELRVRVRTGERILKLEKALNEKNEELQELNLRLEELIRLDPLMDIGNRRSFYETIVRIHHQASRYAFPYGLIMCDIDHFKLYNDAYGHPAGDSALKQVAQCIKGCLRISDYLFRYGGEEIIVVLPEQDLEASSGVAGRIRTETEALHIAHQSIPHGVLTVSCGVSAFDPKAADSTWESIVDLADKALYKAKADGRNTVRSLNNQ